MSNIIDLENLTLYELLELPNHIEAVKKEVDKRLLEINCENIKRKIVDEELSDNQLLLVIDFIENVVSLNKGKSSWNKSFSFK